MKLLVLALVFLVLLLWTQFGLCAVGPVPSVTSAADRELAEKAAKAYKRGDGVKRLKSKMPEEKFGKIVQWAKEKGLGLRRGVAPSGACYAIGDFDIPGPATELLWFYKSPYTKNPKYADLWYEKLYNSVARIVGDEDKKEKSHNAPVILLLDAKALMSSQSYPAMLIGIGDTKTFEKTSAANGKKMYEIFTRGNSLWAFFGFFMETYPLEIQSDFFQDTAKAEAAAKAFKDGDGLKKLKDKISDEKVMGKIFDWIIKEKICLRRGDKAEKACYALADLDLPSTPLEILFWVSKPYTKSTDVTEKWYQRLYNSVAKILLSEKDKESPILLGKGGGLGGKERYQALKIGVGDNKTLMKSMISNGKIGGDIKINVQESLDDMSGTVEKILDLIKDAYDADPDKDKK
eukprot:Seg2284.7 transcript_id=Seg2284.7/GoldUCD/mRNA.D3Y31 product="hypothetical protein" protein_id=Seg2284.7/GoldUCD/D3Y31